MKKSILLYLLGCVLCTSVALPASAGSDIRRWTNRLIPLPKEITVDSSVKVRADRIEVEDFTPTEPRAETALWLLRTFAAGGHPETAEVTFSLHLTGKSREVPEEIAARLSGLPNAEQAYAIVSRKEGREILLIANDAEGLLYAVRTMLHLVGYAGKDANPAMEFEIPWASVVDWPDMKDRGSYCSLGSFDSYEKDFNWIAKWKLNYVNRGVSTVIDNAYSPNDEMFKTYEPIVANASRYRRMVIDGAYAGVRLYIELPHIEQLAFCAHGPLNARNDPAMEKYLPVLARQDPEKEFDPYLSAFSMSNPATIDLLATWIEKIAEITGGYNNRINIFLSEGRTYCHDDMRKSMEEKGFYDHYVTEFEAVMEAMRRVREKYPWLKYDIVLSQGCRPPDTRERIFKMVPEDVGVIYYDGNLTYTSGKDEIIFPLLEEFAQNGKRAGVLPTITHACTAVVPWTGLYYIKFRCNEFVDKSLQTVMVFLQPDRYHCELELMALAEWSWNAKGRTPGEFAEAYATVTKIAEPEVFSRWALKVSNAGWLLADSSFLSSISRNPAQGLNANQVFGDNLYKSKDINAPEKFRQGYGDAVDGLALAYESGVSAMITESEVTYASLASYRILGEISRILRADMDENKRVGELAEKLNELDGYANLYRNAMEEWTCLNFQKRFADGIGALDNQWLGRHMPLRLQKTANALRLIAGQMGVPDPRPLSRGVDVGKWEFEPAAGFRTFEFDITENVPAEGGLFYIEARVTSPKTQLYTSNQEIVNISPIGTEKVVAGWKGAVVRPFYIQARESGERLVVRRTMRTHYSYPGEGFFVLTQVYGRNDYPREFTKMQVDTVMKIEELEIYPAKAEKGYPVPIGLLRGYSSENLIAAMEKEEWLTPFLIEEITPENLSMCSVLIFDQLMAEPERMLKWATALKSWVRNGGGAMFIHDAVGYRAHMAMFPQGGHGINHPKCDKVQVMKSHPVTEGFEEGEIFSPGFSYDHVVMEKGDEGEVLLVSVGDKHPVFIAGTYGKGRYILNGMLTGSPASRDASSGQRRFDGNIGSEKELKILFNSIRWLTYQ